MWHITLGDRLELEQLIKAFGDISQQRSGGIRRWCLLGHLVGDRSPDSMLGDIDAAFLQLLCRKEVGRPWESVQGGAHGLGRE